MCGLLKQDSNDHVRFSGIVQGLKVFLFLVLGLLALTRLLNIYLDFSSPLEITYPNSVMIYHARDFQNGRPIYRDLQESPHALALYGPLAYIVPGTLGRWGGADEVGLFRIGRSLSLMFTLGSMIVIGTLLLVGERTGWVVTCLMLLMFFGAARVVWPVSITPRPDPAEAFFVLLGLAIFLSFEDSRWRYAAVASFVTAFLFKQSAVVAPITIVLYLLIQRRLRQSIAFAIACLAVYGSVFLISNVVTDGLYYLNNFKALRANVTYGNVVTVVCEAVVSPCTFLFALAATGLVRRWGSGRFDLYSLYLVLSFFTASAGTVRDGSADNHFLKTLAIACVIAGVELRRWISGTDRAVERSSRRSGAAGVAPGRTARVASASVEPALLVLTLAVVCFVPQAGRSCMGLGTLFDNLAKRSERDKMQLEFCQTTARRLDALGGPILCQYDALSLFCKNSVLTDTLTFAGLADQGIFDDSAIIDAIRSRQFAAIVLQFPLKPGYVPKYQSTDWVREEWLEAIIEAGYHGGRAGPVYIYQPPL